MAPEDFFKDRISEYSHQAEVLSKQSKKYSLARLTLFLVVLISIYLLRNSLTTEILVFILIVFLLAFLFLVSRHKYINEQKSFHDELVSLNREEIDRLHHIFPKSNNGSEFLDENHFFAADLDVFGINSLYHTICRCSFSASKEKLSSLLLHPLSDADGIKQRQKIILGLTDSITWVQKYLATIRQKSFKLNPDISYNSIHGFNLSGKSKYISWFLRIASITILTLFALGFLPLFSIILMAIVNFGYMISFSKSLFNASLETDHLIKYIHAHIKAMQSIHQQNFPHEEIQELIKPINQSAIKEIQKLEAIIRWLDSRSNIFYGIFNAFLLIDLITYERLSLWINRNKNEIKDWFDVIYTMEAYSSMSSYAFTQTEFTYPDIQKIPGSFEAEEIGHPLIAKKHRVTNNFKFDDSKVYLITGSNMSGKSTFLRTIGLNALMACVGLPVCARKFSISSYTIYTSMRTHDNLAENTSSFYAELKRIKSLLTILEDNDRPVLFFLDEILKGTNSSDRHLGGRELIRKLINLNCTGFISTHDLELADEFENNSQVKNLSFNSELSDGKLNFDYKLTEGKCKSTNASDLMKIMGIID